MKITRIFDLLDQLQQKYPDIEDVLAGKANGTWKKYSSKEYIEIVNTLSLGLLSMGVCKDDKIATIINNCPEWNFFDMALMQIGAIQVPVYPTISEANYKFIIDDAEVEYVIVSNHEIYDRVRDIISASKTVKAVYSIEKTDELNHWKEICDMGKKNFKDNLGKIKSEIKPDDVATIIYTSGTTGNPKGVVLSHRNFINNFKAASDIISKNPVSKALSFLPLCHVYERMLNYMYQNMGVSIYYVDSTDKLREFMKDVHPDIFSAVPRVIEKTYDKLVSTGRSLKGAKKQLFFWALNLAHRFEFNKKNGWWYNFQLGIADKLVFSKWREAFGGKLDVIVSGGATLNPRLAKTFWAAKIKIIEGYGLTETSPVIAVSTFVKDGVKFGTVGTVMECVEVKIANDGEILTKGPCLMKGYYKRPDLTKEVIDKEGWFHTGDIGEFVDGKYLKITDRKKEIFKTSGGKYIAPQVIENKFKEYSFIENIMVVGENKQFISALIIPDFEHFESWCGIKGYEYTTPENAIQDEKMINRIQREVDDFNSELDKTEQVKKFKLLAKNWSVEDGELSPTLKLRRKIILEKYKDLVEDIYIVNT
ncbi:MAG: long-chain fatty acid--CoA ligase [Bacteroidetes bacterium]|nr:long-chain fatty acid--CoA ligase [Bacteroidota bacterium]MBL7105702.1 long-chain fatty acid--CoA ligase [Bacteroidales bacterium]